LIHFRRLCGDYSHWNGDVCQRELSQREERELSRLILRKLAWNLKLLFVIFLRVHNNNQITKNFSQSPVPMLQVTFTKQSNKAAVANIFHGHIVFSDN